MKTRLIQQAFLKLGAAGLLNIRDRSAPRELVIQQLSTLTGANPLLSPYLLDWAESGFPTVEMGHKLAASLMCTQIPNESAANLRLPWDCFAITVPEDLTKTQFMIVRTGTESLSAVNLFSSFDKHLGGWRVNCLPRDEQNLGGFVNLSQPYYTSESDNPTMADLRLDDDSNHDALLTGRLLIGVCMELDNAAVPSNSAHGKKGITHRESREPLLWIYRLTRSVNLNLVKEVRSFALGGSKNHPLVQSLVRGHWKHQACGPNLSLRKRIHIEPYWRGPEDAPIATRAHVLTNDEIK